MKTTVIADKIREHSEYESLEAKFQEAGLPLSRSIVNVIIDLSNGGSFSGQSILTCINLVVAILHDIVNIALAKKKAKAERLSSTTSTDDEIVY